MKRKAMSLQESSALTMDEIRAVAEQFKGDLMREAKRAIRQKNMDAAMAAIAAEEYIDNFLYALQLRAGSQLDTLKRPARARTIHIPENLAKKRGQP